jgi:hypothetical protein
LALRDGFYFRRRSSQIKDRQGNQSRCAGLTETRLRPAARRRLSTAAPALVFMRDLKP